jgi:phenylacetate-coenzyme A ligase PaaK-like adenylate-forming protein
MSFGGVEVASITRTDDVMKVKGVNVFPQAVDDLLFSFPAVSEYRVVLTSDQAMADIATALGKPSIAAAQMAVSRALVRLAEEMARGQA